MRISGIYQIQSKIKPNRIYIGSSYDIVYRWKEHSRKLQKGNHKNPKLQHHVNKYGFKDLHFSILIGCDLSNLIENEQFFLDSLNPWFNIHKKADSPLGLKRSDECKKKESESRMGNKNPFYNKKHSEATKQKQREAAIRLNQKPPTYHLGRKKGTKNKLKIVA